MWTRTMLAWNLAGSLYSDSAHAFQASTSAYRFGAAFLGAIVGGCVKDWVLLASSTFAPPPHAPVQCSVLLQRTDKVICGSNE